MPKDFLVPGCASFIIGGQWGSEAKGAVAAWVATEMDRQGRHFDIVTTNAGAQAGHTSIHNGRKRVLHHLPTYSVIAAEMGFRPVTILNAGSIIDPEIFKKELDENADTRIADRLYIHPLAVVITDEDRDEEMSNDSAMTAIASTRKGVGAALANKVRRRGMVAKDHPFLSRFISESAVYIQRWLSNGYDAALVEVPQGYSLSLNNDRFYPHVTSRNCNIAAAMNDAGIHPAMLGKVMAVLRTYPIRVGHIKHEGVIVGHSGDCYPDQREISFEEIGVEPELTTVTKRVRRVFTWSEQQTADMMRDLRPDYVALTFCNYGTMLETRGKVETIRRLSKQLGLNATIIGQDGPTIDDFYKMAE